MRDNRGRLILPPHPTRHISLIELPTQVTIYFNYENQELDHSNNRRSVTNWHTQRMWCNCISARMCQDMLFVTFWGEYEDDSGDIADEEGFIEFVVILPEIWSPRMMLILVHEKIVENGTLSVLFGRFRCDISSIIYEWNPKPQFELIEHCVYSGSNSYVRGGSYPKFVIDALENSNIS